MTIERDNYSELKFGESLSSSVRSTLEYLGVWDDFSATKNLTPFYSQITWGGATKKQTDTCLPHKPPDGAWIVQRLSACWPIVLWDANQFKFGFDGAWFVWD